VNFSNMNKYKLILFV